MVYITDCHILWQLCTDHTQIEMAHYVVVYHMVKICVPLVMKWSHVLLVANHYVSKDRYPSKKPAFVSSMWHCSAEYSYRMLLLQVFQLSTMRVTEPLKWRFLSLLWEPQILRTLWLPWDNFTVEEVDTLWKSESVLWSNYFWTVTSDSWKLPRNV